VGGSSQAFRSLEELMSKSARNRNVCLRVENLEERLNLTPPTVPVYNSNPGAFAQLYLDFDGNVGPSGWCGTSGVITTAVFGTDGDPNTYSAGELTLIDQIWKRTAEDYAPFNINVTTVLPSDFNNKHALRVAIGGQSGGLNWSGIGGVGCLGSFYNGGSSDNIVFVHAPNLGNNAKNIGMVNSHEGGHAFGLPHQDSPSGGCGGYHSGGNYNGESKGPIMGAPYGSTREIWWKGFEGCGTTDDMAILSNANNGYGYVADDEPDVFDQARRIRASTGVFVGDLTGIISKTTDIDIYAFTSPAGSASITVSAATLGPNLDANMDLYHDVAGTPVLLASVDTAGNNFGGTINFSVPAGKKYIVVKSDGDYGEVGAYTLSGTVPTSITTSGFDSGALNHDPLASLFEPADTSADDFAPFPNVKLPEPLQGLTAETHIGLSTARLTKASPVTQNALLATAITPKSVTLGEVISGEVSGAQKATTIVHRTLVGSMPVTMEALVLNLDPMS
jgi:hypothetical protein